MRSDSYYFVLRERPFGSIPGDVLAGLLISVAARVPLAGSESSPCELLEPELGAVRVHVFVCSAGVSGPLTPCVPRSGGLFLSSLRRFRRGRSPDPGVCCAAP